MVHLETERLKFRNWIETDFDRFYNYFSNAENAKYLGGVKNKEEAWRLMASYMGHLSLKGFSYLALVEKETEELVGSVGLWKSIPWPETELGYWILPKKQGKGYAYEAAMKVKECAFGSLKLETLVSYIDENNTPSIQLAEKLGGEYEKNIELLDFGVHKVYRYFK